MKNLVILTFLGVAAQLDASVLQAGPAKLSAEDLAHVAHIRVTRGGDQTINPVKDDSEPPNAENKVLAFGLDTGAPAQSKNGVVQAISDAFGGLMKRPHVRSRGRGYKYSDEDKKPIALEMKSESILQSLERFLASPRVKKITSDLARKVAVIYRAIEKEL